MESVYCDTQSVVSDLSDLFGDTLNTPIYDTKVDDIKIKLSADLNKLNAEALKEKCKDLGVNGLYKLKKPELVQLLETEFGKIHATLSGKSRNDLKLLCKYCDGKKVSTSKKEELVYQILAYNANNLIFKLNDIVVEPVIASQPVETDASQPVIPEQPIPSLIEQLEKQKRDIEQQMQEELQKANAEAKRLLEEETKKKRAEDERKAEEEKKQAEEEKKEAKKKKQNIPKNVRAIVWNHYIGEDIIKHKCLCCKKVTISNTNYEVGHVLSEKNGGTHEINNLRPICFACNHSMGCGNMIDFVVKFGLYIG